MSSWHMAHIGISRGREDPAGGKTIVSAESRAGPAMGALGATSGTGTAGGTTDPDTTDADLGGATGGALTAVTGTTTGEALARCPAGGGATLGGTIVNAGEAIFGGTVVVKTLATWL